MSVVQTVCFDCSECRASVRGSIAVQWLSCPVIAARTALLASGTVLTVAFLVALSGGGSNSPIGQSPVERQANLKAALLLIDVLEAEVERLKGTLPDDRIAWRPVDEQPAAPSAVLPSSVASDGPAVNPRELFEAFEKNELQAATTYNGKRLSIAGTAFVSKMDNGQYVVGFEVFRFDELGLCGDRARMSPLHGKWFNNGAQPPPNIVCLIGEQDRPQFVGLSKGQVCTVRAVCRGRRKDTTVHKEAIVLLDGAQMVQGK